MPTKYLIAVVMCIVTGFLTGIVFGRIQGAGYYTRRGKVEVVLHLDRGLYDECVIAQHSRNAVTMEEWITWTIANAVSDPSILPKEGK